MTDKQRLNLLRRARTELRKTKQGYLAYAESGEGGHWERADDLLDALEKDLRPKKPPRVMPKQGWHSLHPSLHDAYSIGRNMGLSDLGTYNPASTLPGGGKSDHALWPARAFDLGIHPDIGWENSTARSFFNLMMKRPEVSYVILGDRIWSRARASEGIRRYTAGGHMNHVHVSGNRG